MESQKPNKKVHILGNLKDCEVTKRLIEEGYRIRSGKVVQGITTVNLVNNETENQADTNIRA